MLLDRPVESCKMGPKIRHGRLTSFSMLCGLREAVVSSTGLPMAAIVITAHESKTPGEDFASEERKGRWRELPCPLTIKGFHVAGSLACPGCMRVCRAVDRSLALPTTKLQSGKGSRKSLPCQFTGKAPPFCQHLVKQVNGVVLNLFLFFGVGKDLAIFSQEENLYNLKRHDLERDLLNFNMTGFFPTWMGSWFLNLPNKSSARKAVIIKMLLNRENWVNCKLSGKIKEGFENKYKANKMYHIALREKNHERETFETAKCLT